MLSKLSPLYGRYAPSASKDGLSVASVSTVVPGRGHSSCASKILPSWSFTGMILRANRPACSAAAALAWLATAWAERVFELPCADAVMPWAVFGLPVGLPG